MFFVNFALFLILCLTMIRGKEFWTFDASKYEHGEEWKLWKGGYNKSYLSLEEEKRRFSVWLDNKKYIDEHNQQQKHTYTLGMNHFGDMTVDEFSELYKCHYIATQVAGTPSVVMGTEYVPPQSASPPSSINWRNKKVVTSIKAQGEYRCHSCYAFAAVGALESHHAIATGSRIRLSEQNIIDCSSNYGNNGCQGGNYKSAYAYVIKNGGISKQNNYRYKAQMGNCRFNSYYTGATMKDVSYIKSGSENDLLSAVGLEGPVVVAIDHKHQSFQFYAGGLYSESSCSDNYYYLSHEMVVVGYGNNNAGYDFWLLKNSYGSSWGNGGYMRMIRNVNMCGIATDAGFPIV